MGSSPSISILIVAYQSKSFIRRCVESVIEHTRRSSYEILLVDNGTDGSGALVAAAFPQVRIIPSRGNIGFGAANNLLARHAAGELLLLLNPDTMLRDDAIDRLVDFARRTPDGAAWAGRTMTPGGMLDGGNWMTIPTLAGLVRGAVGLGGGQPRRPEAGEAMQPYAAEVLCGGFMLIRRDVFEQLGGFDESFFLYSEEIDLFTRFAALGHRAWVTPDSVVVHDVGSGELISSSRLMFRTRGQMHYLRKHWPAAKAGLAGALIWGQAAQRVLRGRALGWVVPSWRGLASAYGPIVRQPGRWWHGYADGTG